ncbi:MAG: type I restriction-modification system subunit M [Fibrobacterales bacterium]
MSISNVIKSIQDIMRKDAGVDGDAQRLGQMSWLLFLKIFDTQEYELEFEQGSRYKRPIPKKYLWRDWAEDPEGITGKELLEFVTKLIDDLKVYSAPIKTNPRGHVVREAFADAFNYMKNGTLLRQVINKLNEIDFSNSDERHMFGDIYEQILKDLQSAGNAGEFYTPRAVTRFIVEMINPQLGESILDPACGTGGFLACSFDHVKSNSVKSVEDHQTLQKQIHGVEKKQLPHLLCTTNMLLHGIEVPSQIQHRNTLSKPLSSWDEDEYVDVIVTNPPFGGMEEDGIEKNFPSETRTRETADLFLQLIIEVLNKKGRAAVVLPDGTLFGDGVKAKIKKLLVEECDLHTIVRLPNSVFAPYTSIATNILFFEKSTPTKEIWYYEVSLPEGVKAFNKTKPMKLEDFSDCMDWWGEGKTRKQKSKRKNRVANEQAWLVPVQEVIDRNFDLDIKNPHIEKQVVHDPDVLLAEYDKQQGEIQGLRDQLKSILSEALGGGK